MNLNVYFINSRNEERLVGSVNNLDDAFKLVNNELALNKEPHYYLRFWGHVQDKKGLTIDYGSWSCFYNIKEEKVPVKGE